MKKKKLILTISIAILLVLLFSVFESTVIDSVKHSLNMCYTSVIPSLFPFFILCEFIMALLSQFRSSGTVPVYLSSLVTGFPTGVKNVCTLYKNGVIDRKRATALLHCTANASPAYIVAFIGICIIKSRKAGIILLISQVLSSFACAVFFGCFKRTEKVSSRINVINITDVACESISSSVSACLYVCGYIIFFGVIADIVSVLGIPDIIASILPYFPKEQINSTVIGLIELTRGISMLDFTSQSAIITAAVILGFSGISVILQCISQTVKAKLPKMPIITGKLIYTLLMPLITSCIVKIMPISDTEAIRANSDILNLTLFLTFILFCIVFIYIIFDKTNKRLYNIKKD